MEVPKAVKQRAQNLIEQFGDRIEYIGGSEGRMVFMFRFPANQENGFPIVYLYDSTTDAVEVVDGMRAFEIICPLL